PLRAAPDRPTVGGAAHPARADLDQRLHLLERPLEDPEGILLGALPDDREGLVEDALDEALLAVDEHRVDEFGHRSVVVLGIGQDVPALDFTFPWHGGSVPARPGTGAATLRRRPEDRRPQFGLVAPYFERPCGRCRRP